MAHILRKWPFQPLPQTQPFPPHQPADPPPDPPTIVPKAPEGPMNAENRPTVVWPNDGQVQALRVKIRQGLANVQQEWENVLAALAEGDCTVAVQVAGFLHRDGWRLRRHLRSLAKRMETLRRGRRRNHG